jgi:hypothetical protein
LPGEITDYQQTDEEHRERDPCGQRSNDPIGFAVIFSKKKYAGHEANQNQNQIDDNQ